MRWRETQWFANEGEVGPRYRYKFTQRKRTVIQLRKKPSEVNL